MSETLSEAELAEIEARAVFIAHARTDIPALLRTVRALRQQVGEWRTARDLLKPSNRRSASHGTRSRERHAPRTVSRGAGLRGCL